ncbi:hypothetical protein FPV67DRAFT_1684874 [Lyophyllum atratum]|nr:hypothetical protein FPV67DRAFT_1684874 [Lyophyllum atratum]
MHNVAEPTPNYPTSTVSTKSWSLKHILDAGKRFRAIPRVSSSLAREIIKYEREGQPLIIEGLHHHPDWPRDAFHPNWLMTHGAKDISVRNVNDWSDKTIPLSEFIEKARASPKFTSPGEQERLYGKDAECPQEWNKWLHESGVIPSSLTPNHPEDLLSSGVETLMCYLGIGDTFTPCHKDLCASSGQNLMCYTENDGSSFWFMTRSSDAPEASKYFQKLEQELDHETHVITVEQLAKAPFEVFIGEQQLGDLVLVPPRSCHQVVNNGGLTIKTSWSRMTLKGLETAYYHELPIYRRVCRTETYRVKYTIYHTFRQKINDLANLRRRDIHSHLLLTGKKNDNVLASTKTLLKLFDAILVEEYSPDHGKMHCLSSRSPSPPASSDLNDAASDYIGSGDVHVTCDFCGADIFQSFFECLNCVPSDASGDPKVMHGDGFVLCAGCYVEGRSCKCTTMEPIQCRPFGQLLSIRNKAAELLFANTHTNAHTDLFSPMQTSTLSSGRGTFIAACLLEQARKGKVVTYQYFLSVSLISPTSLEG